MSQLTQMHQYAKELHVLIIDDDENISQVMHELLSELFGKVDTVFDAEEALKLYENREYDIVFSDIMLPGINGLTMATKMRIKNTEQKIVMISAHSEAYIFEEMIKIGVDAFMPKPFRLDSFIDKIFKVVKEAYVLKNAKQEEKEEDSQRVLKATPVTCEPVTNEPKSNEDPNKNPTNKNASQISASSLMEELENYESINESFLQDNFEDLMHLKEDLDYQIGLFVIKEEKRVVMETIDILLTSLSGYLMISDRLVPMAKVVSSVQDCLKFASENDLDERGHEAMMQLEFVFEDIAQFIYQVFEKKAALNVGYLHDSLMVSVEQIYQKMTQQEEEFADEGNDFEFF